jgi:prolipoprotein diacylglyceryl transferase
VHLLASIPSPTRSVWHLGPIPIRAYALCIVAGVLAAVWLTVRRWRDRGGKSEDVWDVAGWAVVFGIIGGRLYHVITDPELYFKAGRHPIDAFKIWDGGLGIWGAISLGALGAWIGCRRKGIRLSAFADAAAPGIVLAQGIGRWGNWFNNELYGGPTSLPWKLQIHDIDVTSGLARTDANGHAVVLGYFQPTFLYESLWDIALAVALILVDRRLRLGRGNLFAIYVMGYTAGRGWIEALRHDHANHILGLRLNDWTAILVFLGALLWFIRHGGMRAGREGLYRTEPAEDEPAEDEPDEPAADEEEAESSVGSEDRPT